MILISLRVIVSSGGNHNESEECDVTQFPPPTSCGLSVPLIACKKHSITHGQKKREKKVKRKQNADQLSE
jgi:hypothetical protein